jgi:uncharacterized protein
VLFKSCPAQVKAAGEADGLEDGQFEALVSVFGNVDAYGDVVMPGAFTDTLAAWEKSGNPIPVYYSHRMDDPDYNIGHVLQAKEIPEGLWVRAQLDLDDDARKSRQVYRLLKGRRLTQFSFAYQVDEGGMATKDDEDFYELRKLTIYEVGPTPIGANQETELLDVKAFTARVTQLTRELTDTTATADGKAGRVLSAKNEATLREALDAVTGASTQIKGVLAALEPQDDDDGKAKAGEPVKDETHGGKSEEPMRPSLADLSALQSIELAGIDG